MAKFLSNAMGSSDGIAKMAGEKVGEVVEGTVKKVMGGGGGAGAGGDKKKGGGFGVGDALSLVGGKKTDSKGGFGAGDAFALAGGKKDDTKAEFDAADLLSFGDEAK